MEQKTFLAIAGMLNSFPQGAGNPDLTLQTYRAVLDGVSSQAITETAVRYTRGEVQGQNKTFAPSVAEFCTEAKRWASLIPYRDRPALPAPTSPYNYRSGRLRPFEINAERLRQKYAGRPILAEGLSHDAWMARAKAGDFPPGHTWIAALNGTVFGPEPKEIEQEDAA